jgi:hypothetical protein
MIQAAEQAGNYLLHVTMVQEALAWFSDSDWGYVLISAS